VWGGPDGAGRQGAGSRWARRHRPRRDVDDALRLRRGGSFSITCLLPGGYRIAVELFAPGLALKLTEQDLLVVDRDGQRMVAPQVDPVLEGDRQFIGAVRGREADLRSPYAEALRTHRLAWAVAEAARTEPTVGLTEAVRG
jgi:myo-inositol 2-dehydrogenase / D-chiro-inositol 1-dehydrogenase